MLCIVFVIDSLYSNKSYLIALNNAANHNNIEWAIYFSYYISTGSMPIKVPRQRKQKKRQNRNSDKNGTDSNSYEILPQSKAIREERRVAIAKELKAHQGNGVVSAKKQKRLNKYIVCLLQ